MEKSDDLGAVFGGGGADVPEPVQAGNIKKTATPVEQVSEQARKNRRRQASQLTRDFAPPQLGQPGLIGLPSR